MGNPTIKKGRDFIHDKSHDKTYSLYGVASHSYGTAHADWTLSPNEEEASFLIGTSASEAANVVLSEAKPGKVYILYNNAGYALTFKVAGQTGAATANGLYGFYVCGATDMVKVLTSS